MPIHDFICRACQHAFERLVRGAEPPVCPSCGSVDLERTISTFAAQSEGARRSHLAAARARHTGIKREQQIAYREQIRDHRH